MDRENDGGNQPQEEGGWRYSGSNTGLGADSATASPAQPESAIEWSASEFVAHEKGFGWYSAFVLVAGLAVVGAYLVTHDIFAVIVVTVMMAVLAFTAARKPRQIVYRLDKSGLTIGKKFHPYGKFKSFALPQDGPFASFTLVPMRRFDSPLSAYLAPETQDKALELLSNHLPLEHDKPDIVEQLMRELRF